MSLSPSENSERQARINKILRQDQQAGHGDSGRHELTAIDGLADDEPRYTALRRDPGKPSLAVRLLGMLGAIPGLFSLLAALSLNPGLPQFAGQHYAPNARRRQRWQCKELGRRQYRRTTRRSYTLKREASAIFA